MKGLSFSITPESPYFEILRSSIWGRTVDTSNWSDKENIVPLIDNYHKQGLLPIVSETISSLPEPYLVSGQQLDEIRAYTSGNIRAHLTLRNMIKRITDCLESQDIHPILLKGEELASRYIYPLYRSCGDIDLYVQFGEYEKAVHLLETSLGGKVDHRTAHHISMTIDGIIVEIHYRLVSHWTGVKSNNIQDDILTKELSETWPAIQELDNVGLSVRILSPLYELLFVFAHLVKHLMAGEGNLRQYVDLAILFDRLDGKFSKELFTQKVAQMGLLKPWNHAAEFAVCYLGLNKDKCPAFSNNERAIRLLAKYMICSGEIENNKELVKKISFFDKIIDYTKRSFIPIKLYPKLYFHSIFQLINVKKTN